MFRQLKIERVFNRFRLKKPKNRRFRLWGKERVAELRKRQHEKIVKLYNERWYGEGYTWRDDHITGRRFERPWYPKYQNTLERAAIALLGKQQYPVEWNWFYRWMRRSNFGCQNEVTPTQFEALRIYLSEMESWLSLDDAKQICLCAMWDRFPKFKWPHHRSGGMYIAHNIRRWLKPEFKEVSVIRYLKREEDKYPCSEDDQYDTINEDFISLKLQATKFHHYLAYLAKIFNCDTPTKILNLAENILYLKKETGVLNASKNARKGSSSKTRRRKQVSGN